MSTTDEPILKILSRLVSQKSAMIRERAKDELTYDERRHAYMNGCLDTIESAIDIVEQHID